MLLLLTCSSAPTTTSRVLLLISSSSIELLRLHSSVVRLRLVESLLGRRRWLGEVLLLARVGGSRARMLVLLHHLLRGVRIDNWGIVPEIARDS